MKLKVKRKDIEIGIGKVGTWIWLFFLGLKLFKIANFSWWWLTVPLLCIGLAFLIVFIYDKGKEEGMKI